MPGPLSGIRIVELAGLGPCPFAAMVLADMGADVVTVVRAESVIGGGPPRPSMELTNRGKRSVGVNLKVPQGVEVVLKMIESADALVEGFRPGVAERLGVGPQVCLERNSQLIYGRMTGWGQDGPYATMAGHDINYIALAGALHAIGRKGDNPVPPLNLIGDFGGGGMLLAFGVVCGVLEASRSGKGQVVDAAMVDGSALLTTMIHSMMAIGFWEDQKGVNLLDGAAHFYDTYETSDGKWISIGSIEKQFYAQLLELTGLEATELPSQMDRSNWPVLKERLGEIFKSKTRAQWCEIMDGTDVCFAPVLSMSEAPQHPHNVHRKTFVEIEGIAQPAPAPRFSRTPGEVSRPPAMAGQDTDAVLRDFGFSKEDVAELHETGAVA
ncbi:MAG TPA: CaiB/BaiF CoA-transferase family protein [Acidimicrobiales bacterium]|nr:CaiB/BaiF CoA-transferase family protein [Acidimicrobiales bacterium]